MSTLQYRKNECNSVMLNSPHGIRAGELEAEVVPQRTQPNPPSGQPRSLKVDVIVKVNRNKVSAHKMSSWCCFRCNLVGFLFPSQQLEFKTNLCVSAIFQIFILNFLSNFYKFV
jgi:hypothetical protein